MRQRLRVKQNIAFTEKMADTIKDIATQEEVSFADVVRECVENDLPRLRERLKKRKSRREKQGHRYHVMAIHLTSAYSHRTGQKQGQVTDYTRYRERIIMDAEYWEQMKPRFLKPDAVEKPLAIDDDYPAVPSEIKNLPQWVLWNYEVRAGKQTKIPKQTTGANAKANTPSTWTDYHTACTAHHNGQFEGIGFVFTETDIYLGIDLDNCIVDGKVSDWAQAIIDVFKNCAYI